MIGFKWQVISKVSWRSDKFSCIGVLPSPSLSSKICKYENTCNAPSFALRLAQSTLSWSGVSMTEPQRSADTVLPLPWWQLPEFHLSDSNQGPSYCIDEPGVLPLSHFNFSQSVLIDYLSTQSPPPPSSYSRPSLLKFSLFTLSLCAET